MGDPSLLEVRVEPFAELGTVVGEHTGDGHTEATQFADHQVEEPFRDVGVRRAEEHVADRPPRGGVDGGELPDRSDAFEVADVEAVQGDQVTGSGGEVTEPERPGPGIINDETARRRGQLRQRGDALTAMTQTMATQDLLCSTRRDLETAKPKVMGVATSSESGTHHRFREQFVDHPRRGLVRHRWRPATLGHQRVETVRLSSSRPPVIRRARDPERATRLRHIRLAGTFHHPNTTMVNDLLWGHGGGLLWLFGRNQRVHRRGHHVVDLQPQPVNRKP